MNRVAVGSSRARARALHTSGLRRILCATALTVFTLAGGTALGAQTISGRVVEAGSENPVPFALVQLSRVGGGPLASASSDSDGRFRLPVPEQGGLFSVRVETLFHHPVLRDSVLVRAGEAVTLPDTRLELAPVGLDELTVEVRRTRLASGREWVRRNQRRGKGTFLPGAVVALHAGASVASYIADHTPLWVRYDERARPLLLNAAGSLSRCVDVLVNRWRLERTGYRSLDAIPPDEIAAIEVYPNERDLPPGYYFDGRPGCGVVNVWLWNSW